MRSIAGWPAVLSLLIAASTVAGQDLPMLDAYRRAERFASPRIARLVQHANLEPHWIDGGPAFWYRTDVRRRRRFVRVDAGGRKLPAFDHQRLATVLAAASGERIDPDSLPFGSIEFAADGVRFEAFGQSWLWDAGQAVCTKVDKPQTDEQKEDTKDPPRELSPDGRWRAVARDHNLFVDEVDGDGDYRLTDDGTAADFYRPLIWSPDGRWLVALRTVPGDHGKMVNVTAKPEEGVRPAVREYVYELPGDKLDVRRLYVFDTSARTGREVTADPIGWWGPPGGPLTWRDGTHLLYEQTYRGFQRRIVGEIDVTTSTVRTVIDERSETFLPPMKAWSHYVNNGAEILWMSERSGWNHLYRIDGPTGEVKNAITSGDWAVLSVEQVDDERREIVFTAGGREPAQNPYHRHWYRVGFDGSNLVHLSPGIGTHNLTFSPDGSVYLDTWSRVDRAPVTTIRRTSDAALLAELESADVADLLATGWRWPEAFTAKGRDGETDIWGVVYRPSNLDESKQHPVIECIYAGPQGSSVPVSFQAARDQQALAELGFIIVQLDGMGMSGRSKAFQGVAWHNLGDSGFDDRVLWIKALAERYSYVDASRVGIYGGSAGGYNAARALIAANDFYSVAVAISGNHDHRTDKVWWNELWMGYPVGPHYAEQSNVEQAAKLKGHLLLLDGALDDNVNPFAAGQQFVEALIRANKDFDYLLVPGAGHGVGVPYAKRRMWDHFVRYLLGADPPPEYRLQTASGAEINVTIVNQSGRPVDICWLDFGGQLKRYHTLAPGQSVVQHTFVGHDWSAVADGQTIARYTGDEDQLTWTIGPQP